MNYLDNFKQSGVTAKSTLYANVLKVRLQLPWMFWIFHEIQGWERATRVPEDIRKQICSEVGIKFVLVSDCSKHTA